MNSTTNKNNTKVIALGGVLLALSLVCLYFASFVPGVELSLYALSSIFVPIMMIESRGKGGAILYVAVALLALLILPNKIGVIPYIFFFGIYGLLKFYIEKIKTGWLQIVVKLAVFLAIMLVFYFFFYNLFFSVITLPDFAPALLLIGGIVLFLLYDAILSGIINYYYRRFYGKI